MFSLRVLFIHRFCGWGGVTVGVRRRVRGLRELGVQADFLFLQDNGGSEMFSELPIRLFHTPDIREAEKILRGGDYDVISTIDCPEIHEVLETLPKKVGIVCEVRTPYPEHRKYVRDGKLPSNVGCIVTPSQSFRRLLEEEMAAGNRKIPIHVVPNHVEDDFSDASGSASCHYPKKVIGWVGRMDAIKNFEELFEIAAFLAPVRADLEFFVVGRFSSDESTLFFKTVSKFKARVNFVWLPFLDYRRMHLYYAFLRNSRGCLLSTSRGEAFSNVVLESMASCCPVVAADIEVLSELLSNGQCGALYEQGNIDSAVDNVVKVLDDSSYRDAIVTAAHGKVKTHFTSQKVSPQWKKLFDSLLN